MSTTQRFSQNSPIAYLVVACFLAAIGCSKRIPNEIAPAVEANLPVAIQVATDAAKLCPSLKAGAPFQPNPMAAPPPPPSPATGSALASHPQVVDVLVSCSWPDPRNPKGDVWAGTSFPRLKGKSAVPLRAVTMPEDMAQNTCKKDAENCEQVIVPSRHLASESSADIRVIRKTPDSSVEVVVILSP
jgi:hypothetical protein